jgi:hypothetical protein
MIAEVHTRTVRELGLNPSVLELTSTAAIAALLRRAASLHCPCAPATLVRDVIQPIRGLVDDLDATKTMVEETLDAVVGNGDVMEHRNVDPDTGRSATLLYSAPPSFVTRKSGSVMLLGIVPDHLSALPEDLQARIEYVNHVRRLVPVPSEDLRGRLIGYGLVEITYDYWLKTPRHESAAQLLSRMDQRLDSAQPSRTVPGLMLLDPDRSVRYYRGRWVEPRTQSGRFVARRGQAYGAPLWCYVELHNGNPERIIDLPLESGRWRGCDEAWRMQLAIDARRAKPQLLRVRLGPAATRIIEFFSPVPMWAQRRWNAVGEPVTEPGCLFAYRLHDTELGEELRFAREDLWLEELPQSVVRA